MMQGSSLPKSTFTIMVLVLVLLLAKPLIRNNLSLTSGDTITIKTKSNSNSTRTSGDTITIKTKSNLNSTRWVSLTEDERRLYITKEKIVCGKPFQHCCIGQGRQLGTKHNNISQLFIKWKNPLSNITTLLDYMSSKAIPCNLWFFGMSLSGDQAIGALCALMRDANYTLLINECVPYANERWNEEDALNCTLSKKGMPTSQYYKLTNPNRASCPVVTVAHTSMSCTPKDSQLYFEKGGVIIVNHGVHCNEPGCVTSKLESWFKDLSFMSEKGWRVMYRETERQHYASANGYYAINMTKQKCRSLEAIGGDYRNEEARTFLHKLALVENITIPIIPLASATEPLYFMHGFDSERGKFDCTHYVYSPWRLELTWNGILWGLKGLHDESI